MAEGIQKREGKKGTTYRASVYDRRTGRKVRKSFKSLAAAKAWRADAQRAVAKGRLPEPPKTTLAKYAEDFLDGMESGAARNRNVNPYKPSTIRSYRRALEADVLPELGHYKLAEIRAEDVRQLVRKLMGKGLADSTVRNRLDPLGAICRQAVEEGGLEQNPMAGVKLPGQKNRRTGVSSVSLARELIAALQSSDQPLWATAFYSGLRRGELQALRAGDVDLERNEIRVARSWDQDAGPIEPKSRAGERTVPILGALRPYLVEQKRTAGRIGDALMFGRTATEPFVPSTVANRAKAAWADAGLEPVTLHQARHTFASVLIDAGIQNAKAISEVLGHTSVQMTWDQYGHLFDGSRNEIRERVDAYLEPPKVVPIG